MFKEFWKVFFCSQRKLIFRSSLALGFFSLVCVLSQTYFSYVYESEQAQKQATNLAITLEEQAKSIFDRMDLVLLEVRNIVESGGELNAWQGTRLRKVLRDRLVYIPETQKAEASISVVDANGREYQGVEQQHGVKDLKNDSLWFHHLQSQELVVSEPFFDENRSQWTIQIARRLSKPNGQFDGVVLGKIYLDLFNKYFENLQIGENGNITLHTVKNFNMLARFPLLPQKIGLPIDLPIEFRKMLSENLTHGQWKSESPVDHQEKVFSYRTIPRLNLAIVVGIAKVDFLRSWRINTALWVIFFAVSYGLFGFALYHHFKSADLIEQQRAGAISSSKLSSLGEMAGGVAHEINNPLAIIQGRSEQLQWLLMKQPVDLDRAMKVNQSIQDTVSRIAKIVRGLKAFARNADQDPLSSVLLPNIIESTMGLCSERLRNGGVSIQVSTIPEVEVQCRETQISQVLVNLLNNSFDAISALPERWIKLEILQEQKFIRIAVTDSGNGIPAPVREKLMQPFFTTKALGQGTGLGLSISKNIIEEHHGKFFLNEQSANTQFVILLPCEALANGSVPGALAA